MPAIREEDVKQALMRIQEFRNRLDFDFKADRMLDGTLHELSVHFLQRSMPYSYCYDLDFIVVGYDKDRNPIPQALVEIKKENKPLPKNQLSIYLEMADKLNIPAFLLIFYDENKFQIKRLDIHEDLGFFTFEELTKWFQKFTKVPIVREIKEKIEELNLGDVIG